MKIKKIVLVAIVIGFVCATSSGQYPRVPTYYSSSKLFDRLNSYRSLHRDQLVFLHVAPQYVTDSVASRFIQLLERQWTDNELSPLVEKRFHEEFDYLYLERIISATNDSSRKVFFNIFPEKYAQSQKNESVRLARTYKVLYDSIFAKVYDSVSALFRLSVKMSLLQQQVPNELILSAAYGNVRSAIPIIRADLQSNTHYFDVETARLALAIFGERKYVEMFLTKHQTLISDTSNFKRSDVVSRDIQALSTIGSQEAISAVADWIDTSYKVEGTRIISEYSSQPRVRKYVYASYIAADLIIWRIMNKDFQDGVRALEVDKYAEPEDINANQLLFIKNWMKANKGKYELY